MKTLHVETGKNLYGGALQVVFLLQGMISLGEDAVLVCPIDSAIGLAARAQGIKVHEIKMNGDLDFGLVGRLRALIRKENPDVVHLHSRRGCDVWGGIACRLEKVPVVLSRRVDNPEPSWWFRLKYRLYDEVISISHGVERVLLKAGLPREKLTCVHDAVDSVRYFPGRHDAEWVREQFGLGHNEITIAMVAQFIVRKGHGTMLAALPAVLTAHPNAKVLLFGQGLHLPAIRRLVAEADLEARVVFAGFRNDLERVLPCMDVLVHPAEREGLGVALLQAAACGLPIIASRVGGIPEIVHAGINGELIEAGDSKTLSHHLIQLLDDKSLRQRYGAASRAMAVEDFSIEAMVEGNLRVYRRVVSLKEADHGHQRGRLLDLHARDERTIR